MLLDRIEVPQLLGIIVLRIYLFCHVRVSVNELFCQSQIYIPLYICTLHCHNQEQYNHHHHQIPFCFIARWETQKSSQKTESQLQSTNRVTGIISIFAFSLLWSLPPFSSVSPSLSSSSPTPSTPIPSLSLLMLSLSLSLWFPLSVLLTGMHRMQEWLKTTFLVVIILNNRCIASFSFMMVVCDYGLVTLTTMFEMIRSGFFFSILLLCRKYK